MRRIALLACSVLACTAVLAGAASAEERDGPPHPVAPLAQAHAHNDYEHPRPLHDALSHGFTSVEADVWLVDGALLVAHDLEDVEPGRTLQSLYLDPLAHRVRENRGSVHPERVPFQLLIDLKSDGPATYEAVERALAAYPGLTTTVEQDGRGGQQVRRGPIEAVISGNRPLELMRDRPVRRSGYDGRLTDLGSGLPASLMPLVSDNWTNHFTWTGEGEIPAQERATLQRIVRSAHAEGYRVRFWATPDTPGPARDRLWRELLRAGVDHINTDDLAGLERFLRR
ncbi:phosphatidylinositol-specific phospholipase C/glycerophosphodiester phosphodiesterase family protein [Pseudonocardia sp. NPDC049635]|uniref:phosphatidylinositol-specific phospholipase C/glycerophosphodiester phosphodiesterase family protein n=1 Tax=Pseudonocardia sp. NPDC049635 TaxID=3155506 RepID=UPI0033D7B993